MKKSLDETVIQDISLELGVDPSFIEKVGLFNKIV